MDSYWCCGEPMEICDFIVVHGLEIDIFQCSICGKRTDEEE